jgi:hypothetical protein
MREAELRLCAMATRAEAFVGGVDHKYHRDTVEKFGRSTISSLYSSGFTRYQGCIFALDLSVKIEVQFASRRDEGAEYTDSRRRVRFDPRLALTCVPSVQSPLSDPRRTMRTSPIEHSRSVGNMPQIA